MASKNKVLFQSSLRFIVVPILVGGGRRICWEEWMGLLGWRPKREKSKSKVLRPQLLLEQTDEKVHQVNIAHTKTSIQQIQAFLTTQNTQPIEKHRQTLDEIHNDDDFNSHSPDYEDYDFFLIE